MTIPKHCLSAAVALAVGAAVAAFGGSGKVLSLLTQAVSPETVFAHACSCVSSRHSSGSCHITLSAP